MSKSTSIEYNLVVGTGWLVYTCAMHMMLRMQPHALEKKHMRCTRIDCIQSPAADWQTWLTGWEDALKDSLFSPWTLVYTRSRCFIHTPSLRSCKRSENWLKEDVQKELDNKQWGEMGHLEHMLFIKYQTRPATISSHGGQRLRCGAISMTFYGLIGMPLWKRLSWPSNDARCKFIQTKAEQKGAVANGDTKSLYGEHILFNRCGVSVSGSFLCHAMFSPPQVVSQEAFRLV